MLLSIAAAGYFRYISFPFSSLALGILCFILLAVVAANDMMYRQEYAALKTEIALLQEELINAQRPDETAIRAKELLPVGNTFLIKAAEAIRHRTDIAGILGFINKIMIERLFADGGGILTIGINYLMMYPTDQNRLPLISDMRNFRSTIRFSVRQLIRQNLF